jgi:3'-phosphoadenosine 5'-phosphosulfate sulfotransferase (PAPS reductase)/FAD synthetase
MQEKIEHAQKLIHQFGKHAVLMCSFGKDSTALLHLIRETLPPNKLACRGNYPLPILYHRHLWFPFKHNFANEIIRSWNLEVHDYPPVACGVKVKEDRLELVARYPFGTSGIDMPINIEKPIPRRDFVCGLQWLTRPKIAALQWPWENVFIAHKSIDVDPFEGAVPLNCDHFEGGNLRIVFPFRHWTDEDVWTYIEEHHVPFDHARYRHRQELDDKWNNPDYLHACTACIDPRETALQVQCPKLGQLVPNIGNNVVRLEGLPSYIQKEDAA